MVALGWACVRHGESFRVKFKLTVIILIKPKDKNITQIGQELWPCGFARACAVDSKVIFIWVKVIKRTSDRCYRPFSKMVADMRTVARRVEKQSQGQTYWQHFVFIKEARCKN